ncbi:hypothetical protein KR044_011510 [Drosophila immigrans]|nr:hypothetical protein KR044_011510 [Drosophila immigrans]
MSSGSSNIDPAEFNEDTRNQSAIVPTSEEQPVPVQVPVIVPSIGSGIQRRRRRRRRSLMPPPNARFRIWIAQSLGNPPPSRRAVAQMIHAISRCFRTSAPNVGPFGHRAAVTYRWAGNILIIDVP